MVGREAAHLEVTIGGEVALVDLDDPARLGRAGSVGLGRVGLGMVDEDPRVEPLEPG